jgi:hypothetical protein
MRTLPPVVFESTARVMGAARTLKDSRHSSILHRGDDGVVVVVVVVSELAIAYLKPRGALMSS